MSLLSHFKKRKTSNFESPKSLVKNTAKTAVSTETEATAVAPKTPLSDARVFSSTGSSFKTRKLEPLCGKKKN